MIGGAEPHAMDVGLPEPPVAADCDLKDFPFTPIYRARLFGSAFHARASDGEWRAGVTLWLKSQDQVPAGSLPDDDVELCRLAELGRDLKTWRKIKAGALHGWYRCSDGRLYNDVVAEVVNEQWARKLQERERREKWREKKRGQRDAGAGDMEGSPGGHVQAVPRDEGTVSRGQQAMSPGTTGNVPRENPLKRQRQRQGQGQGQGQGEYNNPPPPNGGAPPLPLALSAAGSPNPDPTQEALDRWNATAERLGLARAQRLTDERRTKLRQRLAEAGGLDGWDTALSRIETSRFLRGDNERGWRADLDFVLQKSSFTRLMEGAYDDANRSYQSSSRASGGLSAALAGIAAASRS